MYGGRGGFGGRGRGFGKGKGGGKGKAAEKVILDHRRSSVQLRVLATSMKQKRRC